MSRTAMTEPTSSQRAERVRRNRLRTSKPCSSICSHWVITRRQTTVALAATSTHSTSGRVNSASCIISGSRHRRWPTKLMITRNSSTTVNTNPMMRAPITTAAGGPKVRVGRSPSAGAGAAPGVLVTTAPPTLAVQGPSPGFRAGGLILELGRDAGRHCDAKRTRPSSLAGTRADGRVRRGAGTPVQALGSAPCVDGVSTLAPPTSAAWLRYCTWFSYRSRTSSMICWRVRPSTS